MDKKKKILILLFFVIAMIVTACITLTIRNKKTEKYIIIDEDLYYNDKVFTRDDNNYSIIRLGKQIGMTDEGQQVFSIENQSKEEWICVRIEGIEYLYREIKVRSMGLKKFSVDKIILKDQLAAGGYKVSITSKKMIKTILSQLTDKNLVKFPKESLEIKQIVTYSNKYPGLSYEMYYMHDEENDNCFIYNAYTDEIWVIGHELMEYL
jgi:hypothetical protein